MSLNVKSFLANLTQQPGVYQMLDQEGKILYIGKARNLKKRLSSYFSNKAQDTKTATMVKHIHHIEVTITHTENEALLLECNLIKKLKPHYNVLFRDDKSYPYILITTEHTFPRIDFYRGNRKQKGLFFGPFPHATSVREVINLIEKLFRLRICTNSFFANRKRPCLQYQIDRCTAPCVNLVTPEEYQQQVRYAVLFLQGKGEQVIQEFQAQMEKASQELNFELAAKIRDQLIKLREVQAQQYITREGRVDIDVVGFAVSAGVTGIQLLTIRGGRVLGSRSYFPTVPPDSTTEEIISSFLSQHYLAERFIAGDMPREILLPISISDKNILKNVLSNKASHQVLLCSNVRGERKKWLQMANQSAMHAVTTNLTNKANMQERLNELTRLIDLKDKINRIECFDISHTMGEGTVGSCVVFNQLGPLKSDYRRFNVKAETKGNDLLAMKEVIERRYKKLQQDQAVLPDIVLIDGGMTQLNIAKEIFAKLNIHSVMLIGVAKGEGRKPGLERLYFTDGGSKRLPSDSPALHLIQQIRDEAHRFAIAGHRMKRAKARRTSVLESIPGVGSKRRRELLRYFGGIQAITRASLDEIAKVPGVSQSLAQRIFAALHRVY